jgi:hypothetical protein
MYLSDISRTTGILSSERKPSIIFGGKVSRAMGVLNLKCFGKWRAVNMNFKSSFCCFGLKLK